MKSFLWVSFLTLFLFISIVAYLNHDSGTILRAQTSSSGFALSFPQFIGTDGTSLYVVGNQMVPKSKWTRLRLEKRRVTDGTYDQGFGDRGVYSSDEASWAHTHTGAMDADYIYLVGHDYVDEAGSIAGDCQWRIEKRRLADGLLVPDFGTNGVVSSNPSPHCDAAKAVAIDANYIYIGGGHTVTGATDAANYRSDTQWRIEKRNLSDGSLVLDFGNQGVVTNQLSTGFEGTTGYEWVAGIAIDTEFMYVIGKDFSAGLDDEQWRIEKRRLSDGELIAEFGQGGAVVSNPGTSFDEAHSITIDDTYMYIAGHENLYTAPPEWKTQGAIGSVEFGDNKLNMQGVLGSETQQPRPYATDAQWRIEKRRLSDGALVAGFGQNGVVASNPSPGVDWAHAIAKGTRQPFWRRLFDLDFLLRRDVFYIVGKDEQWNPRDQQWRIEKRKASDGTLISSFGEKGIVVFNPSSGGEMARALSIDTSVYVVGEVSNLSAIWKEWRILKVRK